MKIEEVLSGDRQWAVIHADNADVLPRMSSKSVTHVITDPPYSRGLYLKFRTNRKRPLDGLMTKALTELANEKIGAVEDIVVPASEQFVRLAQRWILVFHDAESGHLWREQFGPLHVRCGAWVKTNPMPQVSGDRPGVGFESLEIAHALGQKRWNGGGHAAVWIHSAVQGSFPERQGNEHPCPKPLSLMLALVEQFTDPNDVVLDPFAGSGTTGVACLRLGRRFIGIERDAQYAQIAIDRLSAEACGQGLREMKAGQLPMFGGAA